MYTRLCMILLLCWASLSCQQQRSPDGWESSPDLSGGSSGDPDSGSSPQDAMSLADQSQSSPPDLTDSRCAGISCNMPPRPECRGATLRTYSGPGTCSAGTCTYPFMDQVCPVACDGGACSPCASGFKQWPCYPPATIPFTCCDIPRRTCPTGHGCTCYDACS